MPPKKASSSGLSKERLSTATPVKGNSESVLAKSPPPKKNSKSKLEPPTNNGPNPRKTAQSSGDSKPGSSTDLLAAEKSGSSNGTVIATVSTEAMMTGNNS